MNKSILCIALLLFNLSLSAEIHPLSLSQRVAESQIVVYGEVTELSSYWNSDHSNIYTLHKINVIGSWKGLANQTEIAIVSLGGQVGNRLQETNPSLHIQQGQKGIFMLSLASAQELNHAAQYNGLLQTHATASVQGAILENRFHWGDVAQPNKPWTTQNLINEINTLTNSHCSSPDGQAVIFNEPVGPGQNKTAAVTSLTDGNNVSTTTFFSGTAQDPGLEMIINGSGFGSAVGTIEFADADNGGASQFTFPSASAGTYSRYGAPSDVISWTNTQIRIRVPRSAGTGTMEVFNASNVSQGTASITVDWALISAFNTFSGFATSTRQQLKLADIDGNGGITFQLSSNGSANLFIDIAAKQSFKRALDTWRCETFVNFDLNLISPTTAVYTDDNISTVLYDNSLPSGVLGRATSRSTASANGACNQYNTYWRVDEIDIQFPTNPSSGFSWNFNPSGTSFSQFSFQSTALHEIGHGHGLGHVIDNAKVMHFASSNGTDDVVLNPAEIAAGNNKMGFSTVTNCITSPGPMIALTNPTACTPLPFYLSQFTARKSGLDNAIDWESPLEDGIATYNIEHSINGKAFLPIYSITAKQESGTVAYNYLHENPKSNTNYYRLAIKDFDENVSYSEVIKLSRNDLSGIYLSPNPVSGLLNIKMLGYTNKQYQYAIVDISGKQVQNGRITLTNQVGQLELNDLAEGLYFINIKTPAQVYNFSFIKQ